MTVLHLGVSREVTSIRSGLHADVKRVARSQDNPNFIKMYHGNLEINVPRRMFRGRTTELVPEEVESFRPTLSAR